MFKKYITSETIFIGHSLGAAFILSIAEKYSFKTGILVAGCIGSVDERCDYQMKELTIKEFDWNKIHKNCKEFKLLCSKNDRALPFYKFEELAEQLEIKPDIIHNGNHFETASGYGPFPKLLEEVTKSIEKKN